MTIRPRFSLRLLLSVITVVAILLGWKTNREQAREKAIAALCSAGATVVVEDSLPEWIKTILGERTGEYVLAVTDYGAHARNGSLRLGSVLRAGLGHAPSEPLSDFEAYLCANCPQGDPSFTKLTNFDAVAMAHLDDCHLISLSHATISDAALSQLIGLRRLEWLILSDTDITDSGLAKLHNLKSLRYIYLDGTRVTPAGMDALKRAIPGIEICLKETE